MLKTHSCSQITVTYRLQLIHVLRLRSHNCTQNPRSYNCTQNSFMFWNYGHTIAPKTRGHTIAPKTRLCSEITVTQLHPKPEVTQLHPKLVYVLRLRSHNCTQNPRSHICTQNSFMFWDYGVTITPKTRGHTIAPKTRLCSEITVTQLHPEPIHVLRLRSHNAQDSVRPYRLHGVRLYRNTASSRLHGGSGREVVYAVGEMFAVSSALLQ